MTPLQEKIIKAIKRLPLWARNFLGFQPFIECIEELEQIRVQMDFWKNTRDRIHAQTKKALDQENWDEFEKGCKQYEMCIHRYKKEVSEKLAKLKPIP